VNETILEQWDQLANKIGTNRTAMIHNAVSVYRLFIENQLNGSRESIEEQLKQIKEVIEGLQNKKKLLELQESTDDEVFLNRTTDAIKDFDVVAEKIMTLLDSWGSLPESTIAAHLQYPGWIVWTVLKKLKALKKVKVENGEWSLHAR